MSCCCCWWWWWRFCAFLLKISWDGPNQWWIGSSCEVLEREYERDDKVLSEWLYLLCEVYVRKWHLKRLLRERVCVCVWVCVREMLFIYVDVGVGNEEREKKRWERKKKVNTLEKWFLYHLFLFFYFFLFILNNLILHKDLGFLLWKWQWTFMFIFK